jgi:hypothetical protein
MSGSGSATFAITGTAEEAVVLAAWLKERFGPGTWVAATNL